MVIRTVAAALVAAAAGVVAARAAGPVVVPGDDLPEPVLALGTLDQATAFSVSAQRDVAVAAVPSPRGPGRSLLRVARGAATKELELPGVVRGLVVAADGGTAYAIVFETDRKGAPRRTSLARIDLGAPRVQTTFALPMSARGLAIGAGGATLLVASGDEIRTFLLPDLTSGPLYRVGGDNAAVAPLARSNRVLVAQGRTVALVDLAAAQDRDGLKVLERADAASAVRCLIASPDDTAALALDDAGGTYDVSVDPLRLAPRAAATVASWPGTPVAPAPPVEAIAPAAAAVAAPAPSTETVPAVVPEAQAPPVAVIPPAAATAAVAAPSSAVPEPPPAETAPAVVPQAQAPPPPVPTEVPIASTAPTPSEPGAVAGTLTGPARDLAAFVIALGPDNVLKEATRVAPDAGGRFRFTGLAAGSYRLVAAGANGRVLVCEPPFVTIRLAPGAPVEAPTLGVLKGY